MMSEGRVREAAAGMGMLLDTKSLEEMREQGELYRFGTPEELVLDVTRLKVDEAVKIIAEHVRKIMEPSVE